ncbi:hypothetical protein FV242_33115 [Methylobacterium sp. WL64]|uniref:hypothetical protein n=1 Tax=Methylobacterium sp. WL64 TaxID=2603894 RepID=UPI0011CA5606|nr:hypothetical protein [Methylobacterium sp. WL64]TXM96775.1 hypothetical protein FV242_33115 [Methylobacterium sp. WL64]
MLEDDFRPPRRPKQSAILLFAGATISFASTQSSATTRVLHCGVNSAACSALTYSSVPLIQVQASPASALIDAAKRWLEVAERIQSSGALLSRGTLPPDLTTARTAFEQAWYNTGLQDRRETGHQTLGKAFSMLIRSYRLQERGNPDPSIAYAWADEMINFFRQTASRRELADAMLEKGAIYLEVSQLNHTDRVRFDRISSDGDQLLQDCMSIAEEDQKNEVLRYWSRFYYNVITHPLARVGFR